MKTRNRWTLVVLVLVVACVVWFTVSSTTKGSVVVIYEVSLDGDQNVEQIFTAASATAYRLGYKTADGTFSFSSNAKSSVILKARHEDGTELEIYVDSKTEVPTQLRIRLTEKREDFPLHELIDGTALHDAMDVQGLLAERASRIIKEITASLESL